jgi:hypothetical protein
MAECFRDDRFDPRDRSRLATLVRIARRAQHRLAANPNPTIENYIKAELIAVRWALTILLGDHALPLRDLIQESKLKPSLHDFGSR